MSPWQTLYERPTALTVEWGHHRIFAPEAYSGIRALEIIPIVLDEAMVLARHFPICWQQEGDEVRLVALLSLRANASRLSPYEEMPLAIQAYPFMVPTSDMIASRMMWIDKVIADQPTDIGAPLLLDDGKLSKGAFLRAQSAITLAKGVPKMAQVSRALLALGKLEPWPLKFDLGFGELAARDDLRILSVSKAADISSFTLIEEYGARLALLMGLHRISLFRIGFLLAQARAQVQREKTTSAQPEESL